MTDPKRGPRGPGTTLTQKKKVDKLGIKIMFGGLPKKKIKIMFGGIWGPFSPRTYQPSPSLTRKDKPFNLIPN